MKKYIGCLALYLALGGAARAQNPTAVTGTITDPSSIAYYPAQVTACLSPVTIRPTVGGQLVNPNIGTNYCIGPVSTAINGSFSMGLHANANITPGATTWIFTVTTLGSAPPAGTGSQTFQSSGITISGASQDVGATLSALAPKLLSGGSSVSPNSPVPVASQQGPAYNVRNYGAVGDAKSSKLCATTNTGSTITSTDNPWVAADVGKKLQATGNGQSSFGTANGGDQTTQVTITAFNSAGSISVSPSVANQSATDYCVWYTQQDNAAMLAAYTAADVGGQKGVEPGFGPTLARPGQVLIPKGGYVVCGTIYNDVANHTLNSTEGVSLIGEPGTDIYVAPCFVAPNASPSVGTLISLYLNNRAEIAHVSITGMNFLNRALSSQQSLVGTQSSGRTWIHDVTIKDFSTPFAANNVFGMVTTVGMNRIDNLNVIGGAGGAAQSTNCFFDTVAVDIFSSFCSNGMINFKVQNSGGRTVFGLHFVLHGYQNDECGPNGLACFQVANSTVNCLGCELMNPGGGVASVSLDTTSALYLTDSTLLTYDSDGGNSSAIVLAGNAQVYASQSNLGGNNASASIAGPSTSQFNDVGGNKWFNQVAGVQTACTAATFGTCAFSGGIQPKATVTHTPNTCYAVTGNLLATAQNLCNFLNDQNYQVINITAQSGGTTPANSACATPPVITLSDGTRTATLTMTTAKTQWSSAVDASTVNSVFATGTTLTISIGANTCATPPANVAVSYVLQSVLNP